MDELPPRPPIATATMLGASGAYNLPRVGALVCYFHTSDVFPINSTWLADIKEVNYSTWPGLTYTNTTKYCPSAEKTAKGRLTQNQEVARSTKPKPKYSANTPENLMSNTLPPICSNKMNILAKPISKIYTDDTGYFPIIDFIDNQYTLTAYHFSSDTILVAPFNTKKEYDSIAA